MTESLDRQYNYLLCVGLCPYKVVYSLWRKGDVAEGAAGRLIRMAEGQSVTFKLTKRLDEMTELENFAPEIQGIISGSWWHFRQFRVDAQQIAEVDIYSATLRKCR